MSDDERRALRQAESVPILPRMGEWLKFDDVWMFETSEVIRPFLT